MPEILLCKSVPWPRVDVCQGCPAPILAYDQVDYVMETDALVHRRDACWQSAFGNAERKERT